MLPAIVIVAAVAVLALVFFAMKNRTPPSSPEPDELPPFSAEAMADALRPALEPMGMGMRTAADADARAAAVLPTVGSEDVSDLLVPPAPRPEPDDDRDYLPEEAVEWIFDVQLPKIVSRNTVNEAFGEEWRNEFGHVCLYGHSPDDNHGAS